MPALPPASRQTVRACAHAGLLALALTVLSGCEPATREGGALEVVRTLGERGAFPGQFAYPRAIEGDGESLWVVDKEARVQQIDPESGRCGVWWRMPEYALGKPTGLTVGPATLPDGTVGRALYVADTHYHRVLVYPLPRDHPGRATEITPQPIAAFGSIGTEPGQFIYPTDVAVLTDDRGRVERLYVSEYGGNDRVSAFDAEYNHLFSFGTLGDGLDPGAVEFSRPQSMVIDPERRELILADACNHRLGRFTLEGELIGWVGSPDPGADAPIRFDFPYGLQLLEDSTLLVTEFGAARLQRVDPATGGSLGVFGVAGRGEGELATPWSAVVGGRVTYVLDSGNNRVVVTRLPGVVGRGRGRS